jgi:hypothetical protein
VVDPNLSRWTRRAIAPAPAARIARLRRVSALLGVRHPTERWVLGNLEPTARPSVTFFHRRERTIDLVLLDAQPTSIQASLKRITTS